MLDPRLNHVVAAAQQGSFTAAARVVGVTQSAITKSIAELERQLGYLIFHRTSRGALLTDQGRALISYYVPQAATAWRKAFDFVDEADEAVIRQFFIQMIDHLSQLMREERGA